MPESATIPRAGLFTRAEAAVPLAGVTIDAEITNLCGRVTIAQRYVNRETTPIEAVYLFPLDDASAVCGFEAVVDGTLVVGEVKERDEAFKVYDQAMERGDGAFLLDEERPDVFQVSVGNLPPGKEVLLKLTYVTELPVAGGSVRFVLPTTVSPRYAPAEDRIGVGRPDSETLNPAVVSTVPYGLNLSVRLAMSGAIGRIESPSHPIAIALDGSEATVTLSQHDAALDQDFVLTVDASSMAAPQAWIESNDDGDDAVAISFIPRLPAGVSPSEVIFVVDRSGSMDGTSIEEVRKALQLSLRSLVPGCWFNIIGFGSSIDPLFPQSRPYDESALAQAAAHVAAMQADLGGTEILPALEAAMKQPQREALPRQLVVVTDGEVTNTDAVLAFAKSHSAYARVFTFGIGAGPSHHLVKGLARAGGGAAEFILPGERASAKVTQQLRRVLSPALTNVRLDWGGLDVMQEPSSVPAVWADSRLLVYGFLKTPRDERQRTIVRLTAQSPAGPITFEAALDPAQAQPRAGRPVATLAARARIRDLEEHPEWIAGRGSRQAGRKASTQTREIVALALHYGLMSRETSYVAVERRESPVLGDVQLRRVPVALTKGWGNAGRVGASVFAGRYAAALDGDVYGFRGSMPSAMSSPPRPTGRLSQMFGGVRRTGFASPAPGGSPQHPMFELVALQHPDGSWDLTREFAAAIGMSMKRLEDALTGLTGQPSAARRAWATALAIAWLEKHAGDLAEEWQLLAEKARAWLDRAAIPTTAGGSWVDAASRELRG